MEAVPRLPMISFELKTSTENASFGQALKQYIAQFYGEDPESYTNEIHNLESLRGGAVRPTTDVEGIQLLKKYYCQLHFLKSRFPMEEMQQAAVYFSWKDNYSTLACSIPDIRFELMCILYNIGALHSQLGSLDPRTTPDGMKIACTHFQCAAWAFQTLRENYYQMVTYISATEIAYFMELICLAQAQECILEKSMMDNRKATIIAKVAVQVVDYYKRAQTTLSSGVDDQNYSDYLQSHNSKEWQKYLDFKIAYHRCVSLLFQGQQAEEQQKMGERVALYQAAGEQLELARKFASGMENKQDLSEAIAFTSDVVEGKKKAAKNENDFIYHEEVPPKDTFQEVKGASLVKGIPFCVNDAEVSGPDIFARLVPMEAHEASSLYSERKAEVLRRYGELIEGKDQKLAEFVSSMQIEFLNDIRQATGLPQEIVDRAAALSAKPNAIQELISSMTKLSNSYHEVESLLNEIQELLKEEDQSEKEYQKSVGERPPGIVATDLSREAMKYGEAHAKANDSNQNLHRAMVTHVANLKTLSQPLAQLQLQIPAVKMPDPNVDEVSLREIEMLLTKVDEMKNQRGILWAQLRDALHKDDITGVLVTRQPNQSVEDVFKQQLDKHHHLTSLIEQNAAAQENIVKAFIDAYAKFSNTRRYLQGVVTKRQSTISSLITSYDSYEDLLAKATKGVEFYNKLETNVAKLLQRIKSACKVQQEEREQMLSKMNAKKPKVYYDPSVVSAAPEATNPSNNAAPKLKDYLDSMKNNKSPARVSPLNPGYAGNAATSDVAPWHPGVRPAPVGSEINDSATVSGYDSSASIAVDGGYKNSQPYNFQQPNALYADVSLEKRLQSLGMSDKGGSSNVAAKAYPGYDQAFVGSNQGYPDSNQAYVGSNQAYHDSNLAYAGSNPAYAGSNQAYAGSNQAYVGSNQAYAGSNQAYATSNQASALIKSNQAFASSNQQALVGSNQAYASSNQAYAGSNQTYAGSNQAFSGSNQAQTASNQPFAGYNPSPGYGYVPSDPAVVPSEFKQVAPQINVHDTSYQPYTSYIPTHYQQQQQHQVQTNYAGELPSTDDSFYASGYATNQNNYQSSNMATVQSGQYANYNAVSYQSGQISSYGYGVVQSSSSSSDAQKLQTRTVSGSVNDAGYKMADNNMTTHYPAVYGASQTATATGVEDRVATGNLQGYQPQNVSGESATSDYHRTPPYGYQYQPTTGANYAEQTGANLHRSFGNDQFQQHQGYVHSTYGNVASSPSSSSSISSYPVVQSQYSEGYVGAGSLIAQNQVNACSMYTQAATNYAYSPNNTLSSNGGLTSPQSGQQQQNFDNVAMYIANNVVNSGNNALSRKSEVMGPGDKETTIDLLSGLEFSIGQAPLEPELKKTEENAKKEVENDDFTDNDNVASASISLSSSSTVVRKKEIDGAAKKRADGCRAIRISKSLDNAEVRRLFKTETERYEKLVDDLGNKTLNGPTNLELKWKEIQDKQEGESGKKIISVARCYPMKNRCPDILPYDHSRVVLETTRDDYINASYIKDISPFVPPLIITQSPLQSTLSDFWTMLLEQHVEFVMCLLSDSEIGPDLYWPTERGKDIAISNMVISLQSVINKKYWIERLITVSVPEKREFSTVVHLQFTDWPGSLFPPNVEPFVGYLKEGLKLYLQQQRPNSNPITIHCASGIGRSGVAALLLFAALEATNNAATLPDLTSLANKITSFRKNVLRDREHLRFAHKAFLGYMKMVACDEEGSLGKMAAESQMAREDVNNSGIGVAKDDPLSSLDPFWASKRDKK